MTQTLSGSPLVEPAVIDAYAEAYRRGDGDPEAWLRQHQPGDSSGLAALRTVGLLIRHRDAVALPCAAPAGERRRSRLPSAGGGAGDEDVGADGLVGPVDRGGPNDHGVDQGPRVAPHATARIARVSRRRGGRDGHGRPGLAYRDEAGSRPEGGARPLLRGVLPPRDRSARQALRPRNIAVARTSLIYQGTSAISRGMSVLVVDYVPGPNLRRWVKTLGPLPWRQACDAIRQVALRWRGARQRGDPPRRQIVEPGPLGARRRREPDRLGTGHRPRDSGAPNREPDRPRRPPGHPRVLPPRASRRPLRRGSRERPLRARLRWYELLTGSPPFGANSACAGGRPHVHARPAAPHPTRRTRGRRTCPPKGPRQGSRSPLLVGDGVHRRARRGECRKSHHSRHPALRPAARAGCCRSVRPGLRVCGASGFPLRSLRSTWTWWSPCRRSARPRAAR